MPWNGAGVPVRTQNFAADRDAGIKILAAHVDDECNNTITMLTNCVTRDGQTPPTAAISWGNQKITNLANGVATTDAAAYGQLTGAARNPNFLLNAGFRAWQRSGLTTVTGAATKTFGPDRWAGSRSATGWTMAPLQLVVTGLGSRIMSLQRTAADASTASISVAQSIDPFDADVLGNQTSLALSNGKLAFSVYLRKGANFSFTSADIEIQYSATPAQHPLGGAGFSVIGSTVIPAASLSSSVYTRFTVYQTVLAAAGGSIGVVIRMNTASGVAGADDTLYIGMPKLEVVDSTVSSVATPYFEIPLAYEQPLLERYYEKNIPFDTAPANALAPSALVPCPSYQANTLRACVGFRNRKRAISPTITIYRTNLAVTTSGQPQYFSGGSWLAGSAVSVINNTETGFNIDFTSVSTINLSYLSAFNWTADSEF